VSDCCLTPSEQDMFPQWRRISCTSIIWYWCPISTRKARLVGFI